MSTAFKLVTERSSGGWDALFLLMRYFPCMVRKSPEMRLTEAHRGIPALGRGRNSDARTLTAGKPARIFLFTAPQPWELSRDKPFARVQPYG